MRLYHVIVTCPLLTPEAKEAAHVRGEGRHDGVRGRGAWRHRGVQDEAPGGVDGVEGVELGGGCGQDLLGGCGGVGGLLVAEGDQAIGKGLLYTRNQHLLCSVH